MAHAASLTLLSYAALTFAYLQAVVGAFVRITGSGMGCGDHWPKCHGYWFPPLNRVDLIIEVTHRYIAAALTLLVLALVFAAWRWRSEPGVGGRGGVLRPAAAAVALVLAAALLGAVTVKLELHAAAVVVHLALAMTLIAALALATLRSRALTTSLAKASQRAIRGAFAAAGIAFLAVLLGGVTANVAGGAVSCVGFPHCREITVGGLPLAAQLTHRILAVILLFHLAALTLAFRKRGEPGVATKAGQVALAVVVFQVLVAAAMVETGLPLSLRILHQALGTLVWLSVFAFAAVTREGTGA